MENGEGGLLLVNPKELLFLVQVFCLGDWKKPCFRGFVLMLKEFDGATPTQRNFHAVCRHGSKFIGSYLYTRQRQLWLVGKGQGVGGGDEGGKWRG